MHISEGVLSAPVLASGAALAAGGVAVGLRKLDYDRIPQVALTASAFFVASLIHVKVGPSSAHLVLNGLAGLILGWAVFPALLVALFLQAVLFQFGGLTTLGVNTVTMALPGVAAHYAFRRAVTAGRPRTAALAGFAAGALPIAVAAGLVAAALIISARPMAEAAGLFSLVHVPVMLIEGSITAAVVGFLRKVRPELLAAPVLGVE